MLRKFLFFLLFLYACISEVHSDVNQYFEVNADVFENVTLPCVNETKGTISWKKDGKGRLGGMEILPNGALFLERLQKNDSGTYECGTETTDGDIDVTSAIRLNVKSTPSAITSVTILPSSVLAFLQWDAPDNGGYPITNITLRYKSVRGNGDWHYVHPNTLPADATQVDVYKLEPNTTYEFQLWATNRLGDGAVTNVSTKTLHDNREIELAKHLLDGAETFDVRIWLAAVGIVMVTLIVLTAGTCCVLYKEYHTSAGFSPKMDPERIELIPNIILNPGYYIGGKGDENDEMAEEEEEFTVYDNGSGGSFGQNNEASTRGCEPFRV